MAEKGVQREENRCQSGVCSENGDTRKTYKNVRKIVWFWRFWGPGVTLEGSSGPAGEPVRRIESVGERVVTTRARVGVGTCPRERVRGSAGVPGDQGGGQGVAK